MRQRVVCAEGANAEEAELMLNGKLHKLGPNFEALSVQGVEVSVEGKPGILLTALVQLTKENNIGDWPINSLDLTTQECEKLNELFGSITDVFDLTATCGIGKKLKEVDEPLLLNVTLALGKHGLCLSEK